MNVKFPYKNFLYARLFYNWVHCLYLDLLFELIFVFLSNLFQACLGSNWPIGPIAIFSKKLNLIGSAVKEILKKDS